MKTKMKMPPRRPSMMAIAPDERERMIREAAYYHAEQHAFIGADPVSDWLAAEAAVDALLASVGKSVGMPAGMAAQNNGRSQAGVSSSMDH